MAKGLIEKLSHEFMIPKNKSQRERYVANLVRWIFTHSFPLNRGEVLYSLAEGLGRFPHVAAAIRSKTYESNAFNVWQYRPWIDKALEEAVLFAVEPERSGQLF
jgi:hypothetical protein